MVAALVITRGRPNDCQLIGEGGSSRGDHTGTSGAVIS
jgi:hypothetical protein